MTISNIKNTFKHFLETNNTNSTVQLFNSKFETDVNKLPDTLLTSKETRSYFFIDSFRKEHLFTTVYMMYIKTYYKID